MPLWLPATLNHGESQISRTLFRWQQRMPPPIRYVLVVAIYLIAWALLDKVSIAFETTPEIQIWYPPSALDFVLMLVFGLRYTPALWLNTFVHQYVVTHRHLNFFTLQIFDLVTTVGYAGASVLLLKLRINPRLRQLRDVIWFNIVAVLIAPLVVAWLQAVNFVWSGTIPWSKLVMYTLHYWSGDATGIAMLAPVLLISLRHRLKLVQEDVKQLNRKSDLSVYANFRAALDLARDAFTMSKPENRVNMVNLAINRFLEAQHTYTSYFEAALEEDIQVADEYLSSLFLTYVAKTRCYLELEEMETARICLQEGTNFLCKSVKKFVDKVFLYLDQEEQEKFYKNHSLYQ